MALPPGVHRTDSDLSSFRAVNQIDARPTYVKATWIALTLHTVIQYGDLEKIRSSSERSGGNRRKASTDREVVRSSVVVIKISRRQGNSSGGPSPSRRNPVNGDMTIVISTPPC